MEDFHEWRKRVKYHWYHCRLLKNLYKPLMKARRDEAKHLADLLGDDHDLSMLDLLLTEHARDFPDPAEVDAFREVIRKSQQTIREEAFPWANGCLPRSPSTSPAALKRGGKPGAKPPDESLLIQS